MIGALAFLTIFGRAQRPERGQLVWFPIVGAAIGATVGLVWWAAAQWWPPTVAATLAVAADLAITGLLHFDGLADSADGLLAHLTRQRRLEVMSTPGVGAFAAVVVAVAVLLRTAALAASGLDGAIAICSLAGVWALSRGLMATAITVMPYAREGGLATAFGGRSGRGRTVAVAAVTVVVGAGLTGVNRGVFKAILILVVTVVAGCAVLALGHRRLGGYTGDVLGAAGIVAETAGLLALAAHR